MILGHKGIIEEVTAGRIRIDPLNLSAVNPGSVDLTLAPLLMINRVSSARHHRRWWSREFWFPDAIDPLYDYYYETLHIPVEGIILYPGVTYLGGTEEVVSTENYIGCYDGKSSLGRHGVYSHITAGYVDNGFLGHITLELNVVSPIRLYAGMRIGQIRFHCIDRPGVSYRECGTYRSGAGRIQAAPTPSKLHLQLQRDREERHLKLPPVKVR